MKYGPAKSWMVPALSQTPMWPTNGSSHVMTGIGVHTMQCGNTFGGRTSGCDGMARQLRWSAMCYCWSAHLTQMPPCAGACRWLHGVELQMQGDKKTVDVSEEHCYPKTTLSFGA